MLVCMITLLALSTLTPLQREALDAARLRYSASTHQVLAAVYLAPRPITPTEVCQLTSLDTSLVGSILHRLEKGQMVERPGVGSIACTPAFVTRCSEPSHLKLKNPRIGRRSADPSSFSSTNGA